MLFRSSTVVSVIFLLLLGFVIAAYNGPANGLVITISDKRVRGLSVALVQFGANLVGFGLGPVFIGGISEALGGGVALRWGMVAALIFYLWGALHLMLRSEEHTSELQSLLRNSYAVLCMQQKTKTKSARQIRT